MSPIQEKLKEPLRLFAQELKAHLEFLKSVKAPESEEEKELLRKKLENKFHLIKGGAGFFGLSELVRIGTEGENTMKTTKNSPIEFSRYCKDLLPETIKKLQLEYESLSSELQI